EGNGGVPQGQRDAREERGFGGGRVGARRTGSCSGASFRQGSPARAGSSLASQRFIAEANLRGGDQKGAGGRLGCGAGRTGEAGFSRPQASGGAPGLLIGRGKGGGPAVAESATEERGFGGWKGRA